MCVDACFCTVVCAYFFVHETTVAQHPWLHCPLPPELLTRRGQTNMSRNICACMFKAFQRHYTHSPTIVFTHTHTHTHLLCILGSTPLCCQSFSQRRKVGQTCTVLCQQPIVCGLGRARVRISTGGTLLHVFQLCA